METKEFFIKERELKLKELENKIEKEELKAVKKKQEIDEYIAEMKTKKTEFHTALETLKTAGDENWETVKNDFTEKYDNDNFLDEVDEKFKEITEKTKGFLNEMGNKFSGFMNKKSDTPKQETPEE